jgi:N utilization substance protein A
LAARLTGWDVDIITPPEFQAGVARLDQTLKQIEGITQEMVDKIVALGLIDVRDIEEVGTGPLMEELGLDEETAQRVVDRCAEEAKIVAVEQEEKKKLDAAKRIADRQAADAAAAADRAAFEGAGLRGVDAEAFANPLLPQNAAAAVTTDEVADANGNPGDRMPSADEASEGGAPETQTHKLSALGDASEMSPEEQAMRLPDSDAAAADAAADADRKDFADEDTDTAKLAEGRTEPPASGSLPDPA